MTEHKSSGNGSSSAHIFIGVLELPYRNSPVGFVFVAASCLLLPRPTQLASQRTFIDPGTVKRGAKINLNYYYRCRFAESVLRDRNDAGTYLVLVPRRRLLSARKCVRKSKRLLEHHQLRGRRFNLLAVPIH